MFEAKTFAHDHARISALITFVFIGCIFALSTINISNAAGPGDAKADPVPVSLPHMEAVNGSDFVIPVTVGDTTGEEIRSFQFELVYDESVIVPRSPYIDTAGTMSGDMIVTLNSSVPGRLRVVFYSSDVRTGSGVLFNFLFTAVGNQGEVSPLTWEKFMFNERVPGATPINGSVTLIAYGFEGDVADRFTGDTNVFSNDVVIARLFAAGILSTNPAFNEFQRADVSPRATLGDGQIDSSDVIQVRRYAAGLDLKQPAGGPEGPIPALTGLSPNETSGKTGTRAFRIVGATAAAGERTSVGIELQPHGNEAAAKFTLSFDPTKLTVLGVSLASGMGKAVLTVNTAGAKEGIITILIDSDGSLTTSQIARRLIEIDVAVAQDAGPGQTVIDLGASPTAMSVSDLTGSRIAVDFQSGAVLITANKGAGWFGFSGKHPASAGIRSTLF